MSRIITYPTPPPAPAPTPIQFPDLRGEWRIAREAARLAIRSPKFLSAPRGAGEPVILIPGWLAPEASMQPLRQLLRLKRYDARHWGMGTNRGDVATYVSSLITTVRELADKSGTSIPLIGWSLGGVVAREIARNAPAEVRTVVTYGTPVVGGPSYTIASNRYSAADRERIRARIDDRERNNPIRVPIAAVFSRRDTIVSWPACIDRVNPQVTHYEVDATHFSMGLDPAVWLLVLQRIQAAAPKRSGRSSSRSRS
ncbi:MAG: alpha/beta hydrolase [Pseudomonadota bacterium]